LNAIEEISAIPGAVRLPENRHSCMASAIVVFFSPFFPQYILAVASFVTHKSKSLQFYKLLYIVCQALFSFPSLFYFSPFFIELHLVRPFTFFSFHLNLLWLSISTSTIQCLHCKGFAVADPMPDWTFLCNKQV
jgi:hypothetical protein